MSASKLDQLLGDRRRNAVISWVLVALLAVVWLGEVLVSEFLWSVFALVVLVLAVIPPLAYRSWLVMLPWEVLVVAALPVIGLAIGSARLSSQFAAYFAVAAVALVIVVELHSFTSIRMSTGFAVVLVVVATMAAAALWGVAQWGFDVVLGTNYVTTNEDLMYEFFYSTAAGVGAGVVFTAYFRRRVRMTERLPSEFPTEAFDE